MPRTVTQDLYYNVTGQSFIFDAPSRPASVTSATVFEWQTGDDGTSETATTGSASVESNPDTTFDANSGVSSANPRLLNLTATTGIAKGRQYLATNSQGETEWVEVNEITSATSVTARAPLHNDYVATNTFESTRCSISVLDGWIQSTTNITDRTDPNPGYRIKWVWVDAAGASHVDFTHADVVRYRGADHGVTPADMERFFSGWERILPTNSRQDVGQALIDTAFGRVQDDMAAIELPDNQIRNRDMLGRAVMYAAVRELMYQRYLGGGDIDSRERYELSSREYQGFFDRMFRVESRVAVSVGTGGGAVRKEAQGVWRR